MPNFNHYMNSGFAGCKLLAHAHDNHRNREVRIYMIPGEVECVGVTDTVDRWIAPVAAEPFSLPLGQVLKDLFDGKKLDLPIMAGQKRPRKRLLEPGDGDTPTEPDEPLRRRPTKSEAPASRPRKQLIE